MWCHPKAGSSITRASHWSLASQARSLGMTSWHHGVWNHGFLWDSVGLVLKQAKLVIQMQSTSLRKQLSTSPIPLPKSPRTWFFFFWKGRPPAHSLDWCSLCWRLCRCLRRCLRRCLCGRMRWHLSRRLRRCLGWRSLGEWTKEHREHKEHDSMDRFKGKFAGKPQIQWENRWFAEL